MISVTIRAYDLMVIVESSESHPDHLTDLCNRATSAFMFAVTTMKTNEIPIMNADEISDLDE